MEPTLAQPNQAVYKSATTLFFIQLFSSLAYSVLYATLVLYCVQALHLSPAKANNLIATFIAFNFALHLIGGFLGGRFISFRLLFLIGMILQTIGCLLIAKISVYFLYLGMAFFLVGSGMNVPCINCLIVQLFDPNDKRRESVFLWNYSVMNIGFVIDVSIAGYFQIRHQFHDLFILSSIGNVIAILIVLLHWKKMNDAATLLKNKIKRFYYGILSVIIVIALIAILHRILIFATLSSHIILLLGIMTAIAVVWLTLKQKDRAEKNKLIAYIILALSTLIFYTLYQLAPMALTLFLERNVDRHILNFTIPTAWFLNIDTVIVIFGCPILAYIMQKLRKKGYNVNIPFLFSISLLFIGIAVALLPIGIHEANAQGFVSAWWPALTYTLFALAEICLSPFGFALVGELAPPHLRGILMGAWLMISGVSALLSNVFSNIALGVKQSASPLISNPSYSHVFLMLGITAIFAGIVLFLLRPLLIKLMR